MLTTLQRSKTARGAACFEAGTGEVLVLVHGVGMRAEAWGPQMDALSQTHRVIAIDMPGHGESARLAPNAQLTDFVSWFAETLNELQLDRINVAGHSMGALIAGGLAATLGQRIRRVALLNGVFRRSPQARAAVMARAAEIRAGMMDVQGPLSRWFGENAADLPAYQKTCGWLSSVDHQGYATAYAAFAAGDDTYADCWPDIVCPALFLTGEDDPNSTPAMAEEMARLAPRGTSLILKNQRHMVNLTAPDAVNQALQHWLATPETTP